jgi:hypothetical protein
LRITASFHAGLTTGDALPVDAARSWSATIGVSFGACSVSIKIQSNPESERISVAAALERLLHRPTCGSPAFRRCLNLLTGKSMCWKLYVRWGSRDHGGD